MNALENSETLESESVVSPSQLSEIARGRSQAYAVLADTLNQMPSVERLRMLRGAVPLWSAVRGDPTGDAATAALREVLSQVPAEGLEEVSAAPELVTELAVERTRLLRGVRPGYGLPPACESVYRHGVQTSFESQEPGRAWADMLAEYRRNGFRTPKGLQPDYIGVEVSFLALLSHLEAAAWMRDDSSAAVAAAGREAAFLDEHPLSWVRRLASRVEEEASSRFWPALLALLEAHLRMDRDYLGELLGELAPRRDEA